MTTRGERRQAAGGEARFLRQEDHVDLAEIRAIQHDLVALHEG